MDRETASGNIARVPDHEHVQRSKLRVDSRKWLISKYAPQRYGDRMTHTGADGEPLFDRLMNMTDAQRIAEAALVLEQFKEQVRLAREAGEFDRLETGLIEGEATKVAEEK